MHKQHDLRITMAKKASSRIGGRAVSKSHKLGNAQRRTGMRQITRSIYLVDAGEVVMVEVEATKVGNFVSLVIDGEPIAPVSKTPLTFKYTVTVGPGGTHHGMITCFFPSNAPDDAMYQVFVSGSSGGGRFTGSDILKTDPGW